MAAASVSQSGSGPDSSYEDYSLYSNLDDDELLQLAIERSLTDTQGSANANANANANAEPPRRPDNRPNPPGNNLNQPSRSSHNPPPSHSSHNPPAADSHAHYSSPNPPMEKPPDMYVRRRVPASPDSV